MATKNQRVNLYVDADAYNRSKAACHELNMSLSEYMSDLLRANLELLELSAYTKDPQKVARFAQDKVLSDLSVGLAEVAQGLQIISEYARRKEE